MTPKLLAPLLALSLVLPLNACGQGRPLNHLPPVERAAPVAYPAVPAGEAVCEGQPCLSDRQLGGLISDLTDALDLANQRLIWLRDWIDVAGKSAR